jgi:hypothetical protein
MGLFYLKSGFRWSNVNSLLSYGSELIRKGFYGYMAYLCGFALQQLISLECCIRDSG